MFKINQSYCPQNKSIYPCIFYLKCINKYSSGKACPVDSGVSKHMTRYRNAITNIKEKKFICKVDLGYNTSYLIQGIGSTSFWLSLGDIIHVEDILYVPSLNNILLPYLVLKYKPSELSSWIIKNCYGQRTKT